VNCFRELKVCRSRVFYFLFGYFVVHTYNYLTGETGY
jgi:hypothetical protein